MKQMQNELKKLYDSITNMSLMQDYLNDEFENLEQEHVTMFNMVLQRKDNKLFPGDIASLYFGVTYDRTTQVTICKLCEVIKTSRGFGLKDVDGDTIIHQQENLYDIDQIIKLDGESFKI